jgi:hypothetical protein
MRAGPGASMCSRSRPATGQRPAAARRQRDLIKERIFLDAAKPDVLHDEITTIDHALTRPWTVMKSYRRERNAVWIPNECAEDNHHVTISKDHYFISADGLLMPSKNDQPPPDLRYFKQTKK